MKRRQRRRALLAWLAGLLVFAAPFRIAIGREIETDGMNDGGGAARSAASLASNGLGWWWLAIAAGILLGGALIVAVYNAVKHRGPHLPRAHPA